jgi:hypothetical protein
MRQHAPREAFQAMLDMVRLHLSASEWDKLARTLALECS